MFHSKMVACKWKAVVVALGLSSGAFASEIQISSSPLRDFEFGVVESRSYTNLFEKAEQIFNASFMPTESETLTENVWYGSYVQYIYPNYEQTGYLMVIIPGNTGPFASLYDHRNGQELTRQRLIDIFKVEYYAGRRAGFPDLHKDVSAQAYVGPTVGGDTSGNRFPITRQMRMHHSGFGERQLIIKNICSERSGCRVKTDYRTSQTVPYGEAFSYEIGYKEYH